MATNDIFEVKAIQQLDTQTVLSIFHYVGLAAGTAAQLAVDFYTQIMPAILDIQSNQVHWSLLDVVNYNNLADFFSYSISQNGTVSGDYLSPFVASCFLYLRPTRSTRNGMKRFAGVPESASADGVLRSAGYVTTSNACATALQSIVTHSGVDTWQPAIGHRPGPGHPDWSASKITQVNWTHFGSQNTRKLGRGI